MTGTLDGTKTHKLVLEGLFGALNKVMAQRNFMEKGKPNKIFCLVLQHGKMEREFIKNKTYQEEMDFIVSNEKRNRYIRNLVSGLQGNTLCLFQYVEKHGKDLYEAIKHKAKDKESLSSMAELTQEEKLLENLRKNLITALSWRVMGLSVYINIRNLHNIIFA